MVIDEKEARQMALRRISAKECSVADVQSWLVRKGVAPEVAAQVVGEMVERGYVDDRRYARAFARDQSMKDRGPMAVVARLRAKGVRVDLPQARELLDDVSGEDEVARLRRVLERRYPAAAADPAERERAFRGLMRRGFSPAKIRQCLDFPAEDDAEADPEGQT